MLGVTKTRLDKAGNQTVKGLQQGCQLGYAPISCCLCDSSVQNNVPPQNLFIPTCSRYNSGCPSPSLRGSPPSCDTFTLASSSSPQLAHFHLASPWPYALVSTWYSHCWCERAWSSPVRRIRSRWVRGVLHLPKQTQGGQNHIIVGKQSVRHS
jgi:hypothetical protein